MVSWVTTFRSCPVIVIPVGGKESSRFGNLTPPLQKRPKGIFAQIWAAISSGMASTISVGVNQNVNGVSPVMLNLDISSARVLVKAMMPPLLAE